MAYADDYAKYKPDDPNNPLKIGNIIKKAVSQAGGVGRQVLAAEGQAAQGVLSAGVGSDDVTGDPMLTFSSAEAPVSQATPNNYGAIGMLQQKYGGGNATPQPMPPLSFGAPKISTVASPTAQEQPGYMAVGSGAIWNPRTGEEYARTTGTPLDVATDKNIGSAFQQDYSYLQKPQAVQTQGIRPQVVEQAAPIKQSTMYTPDTTDQSFGGMFTQGLRMKQDRNYAAMNDAVTKNMLTGRAQDISAQGQAISGANDAERNRLLGIRGESQSQLDTAQAAGLGVETAQKQKAAGLIDQLNAETDAAKRQELEKQVALIQGRNIAAPAQPHYGTETDSNFQTKVYGFRPDANGNIQKFVPQMTMQDQLQQHAAEVKPDKRAAIMKKFAGKDMSSPAMQQALRDEFIAAKGTK